MKEQKKTVMKSENTKRLVGAAMFAAIAFVCVAVIRIPIVSFLKYEPKDSVIAIASFIYGPAAGCIITVVVSFIEMITISDTGIIGFFMNALATLLFTLPAALMYKKNRKLSSAVIGLVIGTLSMTAGMLLWNYIITPLYMNTARADVAAMLIPVFLPFNLIKGGLNAALCMLLYKRVAVVLKKTGMIAPVSADSKVIKGSKGTSVTVIVVSAAVIVTLALVVLAWKGII